MKRTRHLIIVLAGLLLAACSSTRLVIREDLPDTLDVFLRVNADLPSGLETELAMALQQQLHLYNSESTTYHRCIRTVEQPGNGILLEVQQIKLSPRKKQGAFLLVDMFGLFVMPNIMKSLDSDLTGRFLLLPWDRVRYHIVYTGRDGYRSNMIVRTAGRVPFFESPVHQRRRVSLAFSKNVVENLRNLEKGPIGK